MIKIGLIGHTGKMGQETIRMVFKQNDMELAFGLSSCISKQDYPVYTELEEAVLETISEWNNDIQKIPKHLLFNVTIYPA